MRSIATKIQGYLQKRRSKPTQKEPVNAQATKAVKVLWRPVGLNEMGLILEAGSKRFPVRLPGQPYFYPLLTLEYAQQIARDWNAPSQESGYAGFVTQFALEQSFADQFEERIVGSSIHRELWVPADRLAELNEHIVSRISVIDAYYGDQYKGLEPLPTLLIGLDAAHQLPLLARALDYNGMDFHIEIGANHKVVQLNFKYWVLHDFSDQGLPEEKKRAVLREVAEVWHERFPTVELCGIRLLDNLPNQVP